MNLRNAHPGALLIAAVVAAGLLYAKRPDAVHRSLSQMQLSIEPESPKSLVYVRRVSWSPDSRKLLSVARGEFGSDGPLVWHDLENRPLRMSIDVWGESVALAILACDGRHVLVATDQSRLWWIGLESDERTLLLELPGNSALTAATL